MIEVRGLSKSYAGPGAPLVVFRDLSFSLGEGEFLSLMGSSGAGKSTLLNVLGCLDTATQGSYRLAGTRVHARARALYAMAYRSRQDLAT